MRDLLKTMKESERERILAEFHGEMDCLQAHVSSVLFDAYWIVLQGQVGGLGL